jgi:crotonobetainyl-CoA:carnitine CoA-transferase CaiB-like acyl-CoA transferase
MTQGSTAGSEGALAHLRVLDLSSADAAYCGKLLADLGALVVKVEPPGGDPARVEAPLDRHGRSLPFLYENAGKRSVEIDLDTLDGQARLRMLAQGADLLIESGPIGWLDERGVGWSTLSNLAPGLIMVSITGFGQDGPLARARSNDLIASALGGAMVSIGMPEDPPVRMVAHQSDVVSATLAAGSALIALRHRDRTGRGQHVDVSRLEAVAAITHIAGVGKWLEDGVVPRRVGTGLVASVPSGAYRCKDGFVYLMVNRPAHWQALAEWIHEVTGNEEVLMDHFKGPSSSRLPFRELLDLFIEELTTTLSVDEAYHEGQRRRIAFTPIHTAAGIAADPHLAARDFFVTVPDGSGGTLRVPGAPYRPARTPCRIRGGAPEPDEFAVGVDAAFAIPAPAPLAEHGSNGRAPSGGGRAAGEPVAGALTGLRVVEFGTGLAAPWIGRILAWAGAEVIKIESHGHPDVPRLYVSPREPEKGTQPECSPWFTDWSAGKRFVALDLRNEDGAELARRLVDASDTVIANYSTGVLDKLGVGYERLARRNPGLVMLESSGYGESGPYARYVTWGPNIEALSGLCHLSGFPDRDCTISHFAYPDPLSALHGLVVLMAALAERDRSGRGQVIHLSQWETAVAAIGRAMVEFAESGIEPPRRGNGEPGRAPYGAFPCQGEDRYVVLCVEEDEDWPRLQQLLGDPDWASDPRHAHAAGRIEHAREIESRIADWTRSRRDVEVMEAARRVGLAAGIVQTAEDLYRHDPQLAARGFFEEIPHFKRGRVVASGIPLGLRGTPGRTTHAGSSIGHDNEAVMTEVLGLSREEYEGHLASGAIERSR